MKAKLTIRTSPKLRADFHKACKNKETTAQQEVVNFIWRFIRKYK